MITSVHKDRVLSHLCSNIIPERVVSSDDMNGLLSELELDFSTLSAILHQFQRLGFISNLNLKNFHVSFVLHLEATDFFLKGGFYIQDEIFKSNLDKLEFEIELLRKQLAPDHLDKLNKISSIATALISGLALLPKK